MDPLDIIENLHKVRPAFQPIISAVKHNVIGYEVLGRYQCDDGNWISLGDFFHDIDVPDEYKIEVDQHLLQLAISKMLEEANECLLFINRNAKQLLINSGEDFLQTLKTFEKKGFPMNRIVLEITEHDFAEDFEVLEHLLIYYKTYGIQIAVDHIGAKSSNIDRIRQLKPHILKIDTGIIRQHNQEVFQDIIFSLSVLARRIGAKLSYENIEDNHQLYFAWKHGGHYYQGFYLAKPDFDFLATDALPVNVGAKVKEFVQREKSRLERRLAFTRTCEEKVKKLLNQWHGVETADAFIEAAKDAFDEESFRLYICDSNGQQISSNFRKRLQFWEVEEDQRGSHWAFRPYFLENTMHMKTWHKGILSDTYSDIETGEMVRTFSYPLSDHYFLFIDISYAFLFENDYLFFE
ncbi:EAL-associated domain-containing protein [Planococcus sp. N028]|uniref:EAL-associated domain-containing protein n=1 Tax=Planococcus shixiaomingii TaxID=3058393 RepID=A0ABT8N478_9BACL|nr:MULTISPECIES: EAL domain-containing protein [unclassified Planococcus (in: firmicutes)]MDN7242696.1 EAL-associated domain-containing protein [Planococcus sp. N028]WKA55676.1 EAL-associated domain-containing protein [Planococcus sp. N022]